MIDDLPGLYTVVWGGKPPQNVITLCGSTKFHDDFIAETRRLTLAGNIVISVGMFGHDEEMIYDRHAAAIVRQSVSPRDDEPYFTYCKDQGHDWWFYSKTKEEQEQAISNHLGERSDFGTDDEPSALKVMLDQLHFRKIDVANSIHVINRDGYVGLSTSREVAYAMQQSKGITWMEPMDYKAVNAVMDKAGA